MGKIFWNDETALADAGEDIDVLAIGDSWFHYPFNNLVTPLHAALERPTMFVLGECGARADELGNGYWLDRFRRLLNVHSNVRLVCISAGGNDFAGLGDLDAKILRGDCSGAGDVGACYRPGAPDDVFEDVKAALRALLGTVSDVDASMPVLLHNYDYAIPDGRTIAAIPCWLKLPMDNCRVPAEGTPRQGLRRDLVRDLIDRYTLCVDALADEVQRDAELARPHLVWSAGTLRDDEWANELHPTPGGFRRLVRDAWSGPARAALNLP
ncbi:MAG TPA: GDSL-type esterase/lipase family protein [Casimicrobiaceae bacterium]|nr:GDSL-type esterase/lipase family protein [Casimicrobiaceae bacterium]